MDGVLDLAGPLAQWVHQWGYLAVFCGIMLENAGVPLPGESIIVIGTLLAGQGLLRVEWLFPIAAIGAILGGNLGYLVGRRGGRPLLLRIGRAWQIPESRILEAETHFRRHSDWGVFIGRFVMILRIFAGPLAGMVRMPWPRFFVINALGSVIWSGTIVGLAYVLGAHVADLLHNLSLVCLVALGVGVAYVALKVRRQNRANGSTEPLREE